ncbi:hypothetical protein ACPA9J_05535 [Pseudomonas aeruginosa]
MLTAAACNRLPPGQRAFEVTAKDRASRSGRLSTCRSPTTSRCWWTCSKASPWRCCVRWLIDADAGRPACRRTSNQALELAGRPTMGSVRVHGGMAGRRTTVTTALITPRPWPRAT